MKLIFVGPPGAGKGTQAIGVSSSLGVPHISTGDMFRAAISSGTPTGLEAKRYMDAGKLVPDEVVIDMVRERLAMPDCESGYLLDGFPRTVEQADALALFAAPDRVVCIDVPDEKLMERLTGRRVCPKCQGTYHIRSLKDEKVCPACGGELIQRRDDSPETIRTRLEAYHAQTQPLIDYYAQRGALVTVDGDRKPEEVLKRILEALGKA